MFISLDLRKSMQFQNDDSQLIRSALAGKSASWQKLVRRYERRIYNHCLRLTGNDADALDLMQEVFLGVYRSLHTFRGESKFSTWVFRIVHNKSVDAIRRRQSHIFLENSSDNEYASEIEQFPDEKAVGPEATLSLTQTNAKILQHLDQLSDEQRLIVEMKIYQGMTFEEIGQVVRVSDNTSKTRYYSALKKLKKLLETPNAMS
jgi:RNA polymerase sigma-70 factor (ECF subfamily)